MVASPGELRRQLGLGSAIALVVGEVIGVGIFLTPAGTAKALGSPAGLLLVWLVMGGLTLESARNGTQRGDDDSLETPRGKLLRHTLFDGGLRNLEFLLGRDYAFQVLSWETRPRPGMQKKQ